MSDFTWHLMADEWPEKGKNDYIIMGIKGGLYLAPRFEGYGDSDDTVWFRDTRGNHHYPPQVLAWAEIPSLEVGEIVAKPDERLRECPFCGSPASIDVRCIEPKWWGATVMCDGVLEHVCSAQMICCGDTEEQAAEAVIAAWNRRADA